MRPLTPLFAVLASLGFLFATSEVLAAPAVAGARVEAVQSPAWRDRGGITVPLAAGMELRSGDVLRTGSGARAYLMLAEGSRVKLGEGARFIFQSGGIQSDKSFRGALDVLVGAFRFTTGKLKKALPRDVAIRVGTATIGIRGTDLWGKTDRDGDLVALLEGRIEITRAGQTTELAQPLTYYDAPSGKAAEVKALDPEVFKKLARQTEIMAGDGAARANGKWRVLAGSAASEEVALEIYDKLRDAGFAARVKPREIEGGGWSYDLLISGYADAADADAAARRVQAATGLKPSVQR